MVSPTGTGNSVRKTSRSLVLWLVIYWMTSPQNSVTGENLLDLMATLGQGFWQGMAG